MHFKLLILQRPFVFSDEELQFHGIDRRSWEEFADLGFMNSNPNATTIAFFRERLCKTLFIEKLFEMFVAYLCSEDIKARGRQIIDTTLIPVP
jgi:IS5 family transposase